MGWNQRKGRVVRLCHLIEMQLPGRVYPKPISELIRSLSNLDYEIASSGVWDPKEFSGTKPLLNITAPTFNAFKEAIRIARQYKFALIRGEFDHVVDRHRQRTSENCSTNWDEDTFKSINGDSVYFSHAYFERELEGLNIGIWLEYYSDSADEG